MIEILMGLFPGWPVWLAILVVFLAVMLGCLVLFFGVGVAMGIYILLGGQKLPSTHTGPDRGGHKH